MLRVDLAFPKDAPAFPVEKLRFALDGKELPVVRQADGGFLVTLPKPGPQKLVAEFAGDDRFEKVSMPLELKVLAPLPKFIIEAPPRAQRGDKVEVSIKGLPAGFTGFGKIVLNGPAGKLKATPSAGGKKSIVVEGLNPGKNSIHATFPGDETFGSGSSNAVEVRVLRKPMIAFAPMSRDDFSRGKIDLNASVTGSDKSDPMPKGTLQLLSKDEKLVEGTVRDKGAVTSSKEELPPGIYDLKLLFTPEDKDEWSTGEVPLKGTWRVVPTARVTVDLNEKDSKEKRETLFQFHSVMGTAPVGNLPPNKRFFLRFRPSKRAITGIFEPHGESSDRAGHATLVLKWKPEKDSWGMAKPIATSPFPLISVSVADTIEKVKGKPFPEDAVRYNLIPIFPPPQSRNFEAYRPLVPAFRGVVESLQGAEIELYEGFDVRFRAKPKVPPKTMRVPAEWVSANLAANVFGSHSGILNAAVIAGCTLHLAPQNNAPDALPLMRLRLNNK